VSEPPERLAGWAGHLSLDYRHAAGRTVAHDVHSGPLRVLQALYPEGPAVCHHVIVHPPGGVVGGDTLSIDVNLEPHTHALITTPGATRFYRSGGHPAVQTTRLRMGAHARLEWLPLENIAYPGCEATSGVEFELAAGAQMIGWDLLALGLPAAGAAFASGCFTQRLAWPGQWLEAGRIDAGDALLLDGALGLAGARCLATMWWAAPGMPAVQREALIDSAREVVQNSALAARAGVTAPQPGLLLLRALAPGVEAATALLREVRARWRRLAWQMEGAAPRIWRT
jgi:urease accessory protein